MKTKIWKGDFVIIFNAAEAEALGLDVDKKIEIKKVDDGVLVLLIKGGKKETKEEEKILELLRKTPLKNRVEGVFEKFLNKEYLPVFERMLERGEIVKFKLSEKYKKAIYKIKEELEAKAENVKQKEFWIFNDEKDAKKFSKENEKELRLGKIKGIKGFDGKFYFIRNSKYRKERKKILDYLKGKKEVALKDILNYLTIEKDLCLGIIEMLKEEGLIIEKRRNIFRLV